MLSMVLHRFVRMVTCFSLPSSHPGVHPSAPGRNGGVVGGTLREAVAPLVVFLLCDPSVLGKLHRMQAELEGGTERQDAGKKEPEKRDGTLKTMPCRSGTADFLRKIGMILLRFALFLHLISETVTKRENGSRKWNRMEHGGGISL